jgi:hypothetical protein
MTTDPSSNDATTKIGCRNDFSDYPFNGVIDDVRIYEKALSAEKIERIYQNRNQNGLVGSWRLNEGEGTIVYDSAGDNDGTLAAPFDPAWYSDTRHGWCLDFDVIAGQEDYVLLDPIGALLTDTVTISAWINADNLPDGKHHILTQYHQPNGYYLYVDDDRPALWLTGSQAISPAAISEDEWHHLAGTYDGSDLRIYVNGELRDTKEPADGLVGIHRPAYIGYNFEGKIDDVRVYNHALDLFGIWDAMTGDLPRFRINNSEDKTVAWFDSLGNLFLKGSLEKGSDFDPSTGHNEFVVKRANGDKLAVIDTTNGNMYIRGELYTEQGMLYPAGFRVLNPHGGPYHGGSYIDNSVDYLGDLVMTGKLYELNPAP